MVADGAETTQDFSFIFTLSQNMTFERAWDSPSVCNEGESQARSKGMF
jgi:hypothetical protein